MDVESLADLDSQKRCCNEILQKVWQGECFILLSGDRGSGRTVVCEQVVNLCDSKLPAVFIPCYKDMQLQRMRELFLQQLLPNTEFDTNLNLADAIAQVRIPHNSKILVVVDDVDDVVSSFYNELVALYEQFLGQERFAFLVVAQPLWAEARLSRYQGRGEITSIKMPALSMKEALVLSRHIFAVQNAMRIYNAVASKLPEALNAAKGNLSQIINITERLMRDPTTPPVNQGGVPGAGGVAGFKSKKKTSSVGIFVTVVCIIIVLACLVPIFLGGNFFSSDEGTKPRTTATVPNEDALVFNQGRNQGRLPGQSSNQGGRDITQDHGVLPERLTEGLVAPTQENEMEHSMTLSGEQLDKIEGRANGSGYPRGVGGSVANGNQANNQGAANAIPVLRRGDNLNHINNSAQAPHTNTTAVDISQNFRNQANQAQNNGNLNANDLAEAIAQDRAALEQATRQKIESDAKAAREAQLAAQKAEEEAKAQAAAQKAKQEAEAKAKQEAEAKAKAAAAAKAQPAASNNAQPTDRETRPALKAGQIINLADEQRQSRPASRPANTASNANNQAASNANRAATPAGRGYEGSLSELAALSDSRWTIQIVSGSVRSNVAAAARDLSGRYWIVPSTRGGRPWYVLMAGDYASREEAAAAARNIPRSVSQGAVPFAKRVSDAKHEMRQ